LYYMSLYELLPTLAMKETRTISVMGDNDFLPKGDYSLVEMYCSGRNCDCRRVMFSVMTAASKDALAVISYGWEDRDFYARWFKRYINGGKDINYESLDLGDKRCIDEMMGPSLNALSRQSRYANVILEFVAENVLTNEMYVERLKRHYRLFKRKLEKVKKRKDE